MNLLKMRKTVLALAASVMLPFSANADDVVTFRITGQDGAVKEFVLDDISRLTFGAETFTMVFNNAAANEEFRYDDVLNMQFGFDGITGVQQVADEADITIRYDGVMLIIDGCPEGARLAVYDISGRPVINQSVQESAQISTEQLTAGVYILKINNKTFKFSKL